MRTTIINIRITGVINISNIFINNIIIIYIFIYNVIKINSIKLKGKTKMVRNKKASKPGYKKAIVTLKKGQSIDLTTGI